MNRGLTLHYHKLLLALAAGSMVVSSGWFGQQEAAVRRLRAVPVAARLPDARYEPAMAVRPAAVTAGWAEPVAQSQGAGWLYEVFTPPAIYYNARVHAFAVSLPHFPAEEVPSSGLELLAVKREPYRLQLAGYVGAPGDYLVAFTIPGAPGTRLARVGHHFDDLGLMLQRFEVKKVPVEHTDSRPVFEVAALAVMREEATGREVILDSRAATLTDTPVALFQSRTGGGPPRELRAGDILADGPSTYRIERIQLDPPEVAISRQSAGLPPAESRILRPANPGTGATSGHLVTELTLNHK